MTTYTAPPAFLAGIPDRLLVRRRSATQDLRRARDLIGYCEQRGYRPSLLDVENERKRRAQR